MSDDPKRTAAKKQWREMTVDLGPFQAFDGPLITRPANRHDTLRMFGNPTDGDGELSVEWKQRNITSIHGDDAIPGMQRWYFSHNRQLTEYFAEFFRRAEAVAPGYITRAGGFNFRRIRHDTPEKAEARKHKPPLQPLSEHAFGTAADVMAEFNKAVEGWDIYKRLPWSAMWNTRWKDGVPRGIVQAALSCGFSWGGFWNDFCDPMHFQWCGQSDLQV